MESEPDSDERNKETEYIRSEEGPVDVHGVEDKSTTITESVHVKKSRNETFSITWRILQ
jgi:hypothetical protein